MDKNYSLRYFIDIFGDEKEAYVELLQTLVESLEEWREAYGPTLLSGDLATFSFHRHKAVTLMENLEMKTLLSLSEIAKTLVTDRAPTSVLSENILAATEQIDQAILGLKEDLDQA